MIYTNLIVSIITLLVSLAGLIVCLNIQLRTLGKLKTAFIFVGTFFFVYFLKSIILVTFSADILKISAEMNSFIQMSTASFALILILFSAITFKTIISQIDHIYIKKKK